MATQTGREDEQAALDDLAQYTLSDEDARKMFDAKALRLLGISGEEFIRRWDAGEIDFDAPETHSAVVQLWMMLPYVREERAD